MVDGKASVTASKDAGLVSSLNLQHLNPSTQRTLMCQLTTTPLRVVKPQVPDSKPMLPLGCIVHKDGNCLAWGLMCTYHGHIKDPYWAPNRASRCDFQHTDSSPHLILIRPAHTSRSKHGSFLSTSTQSSGATCPHRSASSLKCLSGARITHRHCQEHKLRFHRGSKHRVQ